MKWLIWAWIIASIVAGVTAGLLTHKRSKATAIAFDANGKIELCKDCRWEPPYLEDHPDPKNHGFAEESIGCFIRGKFYEHTWDCVRHPKTLEEAAEQRSEQ